MTSIGREAGLLVSYTELAKAWYRIKKAVYEAQEHGDEYLVIRPATTQPCGFQVYSTRLSPDATAGLHTLVPVMADDFNWVANAMYYLQRDGYFSAWTARKASHSGYTEIDAFINEAVMFEIGLAPNSAWVEGKLAEYEGTLKLTRDHNFEFVYDDSPYNKYLKDQVHSTTFLDVEEAVAVFGHDVISDVLDGEERRVTYLRFRAK